MPKISVLMPVYNAEKFLDESILSILNQTFTNFNFLIVDDASTDNSLTIIQKYAKQDERIIVLHNKKNKGAVNCRNILLEKTNTEFIAWLDADDLSLAHRLQTQLEFLIDNPDIDIIGAAAICIGEKGKKQHVLTDHQIKTSLLMGCAFVQSSTMLRMSKIKKNNLTYNNSFASAHDYKFWVDCAPFVKFTNFNSVLIKYRIHPNQISVKHKKAQESFHLAIMKSHLATFDIIISDNILLALLGWNNQKINTKGIAQLFLNPVFAIKNFYGYNKVSEDVVLKQCHDIIDVKTYFQLGWKAKWLFFKNFGLKLYSVVRHKIAK